MIATRADKATEMEKHNIHVVYYKLRKRFGEYFRFVFNEPFLLDAHKSWNDLTVCLRTALGKLHQQLVDDDESPRQPEICQRIRSLLPAMCTQLGCPVMRRTKFVCFMQTALNLEDGMVGDLSELFDSIPIEVEEDFLAQPGSNITNGVPSDGRDFLLPQHSRFLTPKHRDETPEDELVPDAWLSLMDKAVHYLSGFAIVLSFNLPLAQDYIVIEPQWLLSKIIGRLMSQPPLPRPYIHYKNGYARKDEVIRVLTTDKAPGEVALQMAKDLGFCLERGGMVLNTSKLLTKRLDRHWECSSLSTVIGGRRLECRGAVAIANTFFPHLQVHFYHHYLEDYNETLPMWQGGIRLVAGARSSAEALVEANPANMSIDIIARGPEQSDEDCAKLLDDLTEEILQKAAKISPSSQLKVVYLSHDELSTLSACELRSRPEVTYSEERVMRALRDGHHVSDGTARHAPEDPRRLLLPLCLQALDFDKAVRHLARSINSYDECNIIADHLCLNSAGQDIVKQLRHQNPARLSSDVAGELFRRWLEKTGFRHTAEQKRDTLREMFCTELCRPELAKILDTELGIEDDDQDEVSLPKS